jgi:hypothetical protein
MGGHGEIRTTLAASSDISIVKHDGEIEVGARTLVRDLRARVLYTNDTEESSDSSPIRRSWNPQLD